MEPGPNTSGCRPNLDRLPPVRRESRCAQLVGAGVRKEQLLQVRSSSGEQRRRRPEDAAFPP